MAMPRMCVCPIVVLCAAVAHGESATPPTPPKLRLGDAAQPVRYAARLRVLPSEPTFAGTIDIDLKLKAPATVVWMNGTNLTIAGASFDVGGKKVPAQPVAGDENFLGFAVDSPLPAGAARLHVDYTGLVSRKDDRGMFGQKEGERWYALTQLEAISARRVFPCFDEPSFKVPWQLTIEAPKGDAVFSNTSPTSEREEHPGMKTVAFAETPPLPSYLVAVAIGPYDVVDIGPAGVKKTPQRIAAPFGRGPNTRFAGKVTGEIVSRLEAYFGTPFPFDKLDEVSVPLPSSFGAMENPGMITWAQSWIVARPEDESIGFQRNYVEVAAHEIAHQWFGDMVTLAWWDDVWLNESFASWLAGKIVDGLHPEWTHGTHPPDIRGQAMAADSLVSARQIRQPIVTNDDIFNAFDVGITYNKGEAVLDMFERFIGADVFQKGIRRYIAGHAHGVATADDFFAAMSAAAGRDLSPAFRTFLDQPGVPLVTAALACAPGKPAALNVTQERYVPLGAVGAAPQTWQVPVCVKWRTAGATRRSCTLVTEKQASLPLGAGCPEWVLANDGEAGYYRVAYRGDLLGRLLGGTKPLDLPETVGMLDDVKALVDNGMMPIGDALAFVPELAADPRRQAVEAAAGLADRIHERLVPARLRPSFRRFVQKDFGPRARKLGWQPSPGDDDDTRLLRGVVVGLVADKGEDRELRAQAIELTRRWIADRKAIAPGLVEAVLGTAAAAGDRALFDLLYKEAKRAEERRDRTRILGALARFRDPKLAAAALDLVVGAEFDARETTTILFTEVGWPTTRPIAWDFVKRRYDAIAGRLPADTLAFLPFVATSFCDQEHLDDMVAFFKDRSPKLPGGPRILAQATEATRLCMAYKKTHAASAAKFLARY